MMMMSFAIVSFRFVSFRFVSFRLEGAAALRTMVDDAGVVDD